MSVKTQPFEKYRTGDQDEDDVDIEQLVTLLGDEYTRKIIAVIGDDSLSAREISNRTDDISRPTIYRRINDLKDTGVIDTSTQLDSNGHHKDSFELNIDEITISITELKTTC